MVIEYINVLILYFFTWWLKRLLIMCLMIIQMSFKFDEIMVIVHKAWLFLVDNNDIMKNMMDEWWLRVAKYVKQVLAFDDNSNSW